MTLAIESINQLNNRQLLEQGRQEAQHAIDTQNYLVNQTQTILDNQTANTHRIQTGLQQGKDIIDNQIILVRELGNATNQLNNQSSSINQQAKVLVLQGASLNKSLDFLRKNFNEDFLKSEVLDKQRTFEILKNVTEIQKALKAFTLSPPSEESGNIAGLNGNRNVTVLP